MAADLGRFGRKITEAFMAAVSSLEPITFHGNLDTDTGSYQSTV